MRAGKSGYLIAALVACSLALSSAAMGDRSGSEELRTILLPGYGNSRTLFVSGMVFKVEPEHREAIEKIPVGKLKRFVMALVKFFPEAEEEGNVVVEAEGAKAVVTTDESGCFSAALTALSGKPWQGAVSVRVHPRGGIPTRGVAYVANPGCVFGIISDIDDTIKVTGVHDRTEVVKRTILGDAKSDEPVQGMARLYRRIVGSGRHGARPVHYVSASPYSLADRLVEFISLNDFPAGSLSLMKLELGEDLLRGFTERIIEHKRKAIGDLFSAFPGRKFILFGDDGQSDPPVYSDLALCYPGRVAAVYIRRTPGSEIDESDYPLCFFFSSPDEVRSDLARREIIGTASLERNREAVP